MRTLREAAGLRRERVAVALDRSFSSVIKWERDENVPTARDIGHIAEVLGCNIDALFVDAAGAPVTHSEAVVGV